MLQPPHVRARQRFIRRYSGPIAAGLIVGAGAYYFFVFDNARPAAASAGAPLMAAVSAAPYPDCDAARAAGAAPVR